MADWKNRIDQITNKVKFQLNAKGIDNIKQLSQTFQSFDRDGNGTLDKLEFEEMMSKLGVFLARQELRVVYDTFDMNKDGKICYQEFVNTIKQDMSNDRLAIVKKAWQKLSGGAATCSLEKIIGSFNAPAHPRVASREKRAENVMSAFVELMSEKASNGQVSEEAFIDFYADVNACLPAEKESYFIDSVLKVWGLNGTAVTVPAVRLQEIEDCVFEKVRQRTHGADDEGKTMRKLFKHFDLDGFGTIEFSEFCKALETIGCLYKQFEMRALFDKFDKDGNNRLDYEEFASMFAIRGSGNNPNVNPVFGVGRQPPNQVLSKVLEVLKGRGMHGIRGLGIVFRRMDNNGDRRLDRSEFMWGLRENGHTLSPSEFERIFKYFDKNNDGKISYDEFLRGVRGDLNDFRRGFVDIAFNKLDKTGDGIVNLADLENTYDVSFHPKYKSGEMSKKEILTEFMAQWDTLKKDGTVTREEFYDYFADVSASIDEDEYFELMIRNAWHIAGGEGQSANTSIPRHLVTDANGNQRVEMAAGHENMTYDKNLKTFFGADL